MTFLELVNRARRECGVAGPALTTLQTSLTAEGQRFTDWVGQAWVDIQLRHDDWQWMRKDLSFSTVANQQTYTLAQMGASDLNNYVRDSFRVYLTSAGIGGEQFLSDLDWPVFRDSYVLGSLRSTASQPVAVTVKPDHSLALWPLPIADYTVKGEYYRAPVYLTADGDSPSAVGFDMPGRFHMLIVYMAMQSYAAYEAAPEVQMRGEARARRLLNALELWGMPMASMAAALC